jgi:hypothetical protein
VSDDVDASFYVQIEPDLQYSYVGNEPKVVGAKAVRITQGRSLNPLPGTVQVRLEVRLPKAAFMPLRPAQVIVIPADFVVPGSITAAAGDANEAS